MFNKRIKYFHFCVVAVCFVFSSISAAEAVGCEGFLLPSSAPSAAQQEVIKKALQEADLINSLYISAEPAVFSLQPKGMPHLQLFAASDLTTSTQVLTSTQLPADELLSLAKEAFRRTTDSTPHHLSLASNFVTPSGRPRIRTGLAVLEADATEKPQEESLAIFSVVMLDASEPGTLDVVKINLQFYKHLRDLLNYTKTQEPTPSPQTP